MTPNDDAVIRVSYSIDQVSGELVWHVRDERERNLYKKEGRYAGSVHLLPDDLTYVEVWGNGPLDRFASAMVLDAALIAVPHTGVDSYSAPSPFTEDRAVIPLVDWTPPSYVDSRKDKLRFCMQRTVTPLKVIQPSGRWDLSLALTVAIEVVTPAGIERQVRVFVFDPESEVGTGADGHQ